MDPSVLDPQAVASDGRDGTDASAESRDVIEPISGHGAHMLHQRANAAKRAWSRADAWVSIAQGYLLLPNIFHEDRGLKPRTT